MIKESLKKYEWCRKVRMKLFEGSEFICTTEEVDDADDSENNQENISIVVIEVINDTGWFKEASGRNLYRGLSCGFFSSAIGEIEILEE